MAFKYLTSGAGVKMLSEVSCFMSLSSVTETEKLPPAGQPVGACDRHICIYRLPFFIVLAVGFEFSLCLIIVEAEDKPFAQGVHLSRQKV